MKPALVEYLDLLETEDLRHVLPTISVPTLLIVGTDDPICDSATVGYLQEHRDEEEFFFFEKCGHFPFLSKPHEFNEVLQKFLDDT